MNRRHILIGTFALALVGCGPAAVAAPAFQPTRFSVVTKGSGPDVILIPGLTASRAIWNGTVAAVPGYRYHLVQVAGFAGERAGGNAQGRVVAPVAEEIARYINARGLQRPAIVGHSMGGTIGMMVAARHPERVGKVMVVDMLPQPAGLLGSSASNVRGLADSLQRIIASPGGGRLVETAIGLFGNRSPGDPASDSDVVARATHELALTDLTPELPKIRAPMTVVYAAPGDPRLAAQARAAYTSAYGSKRGAKLVRVDNSGHMIMYEQPARFREALKAFLKPA